MYIYGHFCYAERFSITTNGLEPDIEIDKKSDSPDEDKSIGDSL